MIIHYEQFKIYFGNAYDGLTTDWYRELNERDLLTLQPFSGLKSLLSINKLMFAEQRHGIKGAAVTSELFTTHNAFRFEGDYLITNQSLCGIGVMSADCLPIVLLDTKHNACGIVHAGWRGSVNHIIRTALEHMRAAYNTQPSDVQVVFGPAAGPCCYQVQPDFKDEIEAVYHDLVFVLRGAKLFFDNSKYNILQLMSYGVPSSHIDTVYNVCTICNTDFCSYRRDINSARQMSVVSIVR